MSDTDKTVFISYRRDVASFIARAIFMDLRMNGYDVFMDVESIDSGTFDTVILNQIAARAHFVLILTPGSVERCADNGDWLRREIETAMDLGRNVVPLLVNNFTFKGNERYLTGKLEQLVRYNALNVPHDYFDEAMARLRTRFLKQPVTGTVVPTPPTDQSAVEQKIEEVVSQPAPSADDLKAENYFAQGETMRRSGNYDEAIALYTEAIRLSDRYALAYYHRGLAYEKQGNDQTALADYSRAIDLAPDHLDVFRSRGLVRVRLGDVDGAIADRDKARQRDKKEFARAYMGQGHSSYEENDFDQAIAHYTKAIETDPDYLDAHVARAEALRAKGNKRGALEDYSRVIQRNSSNASVYFSRGSLYYDQQDYDLAIADWTEVIRLRPEQPTSFSNRGEAYFALARYEQALADFETAMNLDATSKFARAGLAITYHALGQEDKAKETWLPLTEQDARYRTNVYWVRSELNWAPPLVEEARKLIAKL